MINLFHKRAPEAPEYDPREFTPAIRSSICTGEKVAGFREKATGRFREVMLIQSPRDLEEFRRRYRVSGDIETIY